ncbi:LacI family DNA-binding transcriptional regulator [Proteiniphilum sp. UBA5480]|jgi:LacI family transcriptional regulator|uniref:LacI family DNA-binding transcriptional regulator n=1 Tax=Proteiniphilum sp. UBA5480 TaxID=1947282 RepID=UPI002579DCDC|nr:LacI family DNA-binding transcriptional regulator [Proteiniphilum sp. UBA5480]
MKPKRTTIKDIAKHLGLSVSTVSRALNDSKNIKKETKDLIRETAHALNYRSNPIGLSLKHGVTNTIGVLVPEMVTPFASEVITGIQETLNKTGYKVIIAQSDEDPVRERENLQLMENFMVDGIIICPCDYKTNKKEYLRLQDNGIPIVFYDRIPFGMNVPNVIVDDYRETFFMIEHLIRLGRRKIVYIQGPNYIYNSVERIRGYKDALKKFSISYDESLVVYTGMTFDDGGVAAEKLLNRGVKFDAIFTFTETLALGAMNYLKYNQIKIPKEVAMASFSGTILSTVVYPQLTSIEQPKKMMGETAANLILEKIANPSVANKKIILSSEIKLRASTEISLLKKDIETQ